MNKILVIEDNQVNIKLFTMLLKKSGYQVDVAKTAEDGVELAASAEHDLVVMDLQLPGDMDGVEATRHIRANEATAGVPIVVVSAHAFQEIREAALQAGANAFLTKPYTTRTFLDTVRELIEGAGS